MLLLAVIVPSFLGKALCLIFGSGCLKLKVRVKQVVARVTIRVRLSCNVL